MNKEFQTLRKKQRFGLRKLNIGVASVLLGFTIFGYNLASQAPVAHAAASAVATASAGSGASGSSATGLASGSQASNSQAASATSSAATASQAAPETQVTAPAASQSSAPANSDNASSSTANHTASNTNTTPSSKTGSVNETTSPAAQSRILMTKFLAAQSQNLIKSAQNSGPDTTLPTTTQTYTPVYQPLLYDYLLHGRDGQTWVDKTVATGVWDYPSYTLDTIFGKTSKPGIITSNPDKYFFAAYVDYSEQYHRVILLARGQDPSDKNLYSYTIHTYSQNNSTTTTKPGESIKEQYTGPGGSTHDLIFQNYGDSFSVKLIGRLKDGYGLLPVFDEGLLDPTYGSNTLDQNDAAAKAKSISFWASALPQKTSTKVRYVDQATGKDIVQPMEISGFGYQGFKVKGDAPTVKGYHLVSKPEFLPSTNKASTYEDGTISPYKVGQTYDLALSDSVVIKQTVIDTNGTVRATAYYNGSRLPSTDASKVLGRESYNDKMSFGAPDGKFYTYTNRIGKVDDSYIYYYAKDSDPDGSEMRLHFIDVTGVNNSNYAPSDGPELDVDKVQTIHGKMGDNYSFTYTVPKGYDQVAASGVTGTYSKTRHDAYVYVKANTPKPVTTPVTTNENTTLTDEQAEAGIANNSELPDGTTYTWSKQPDTTQPGDTTGEVTVKYPGGTSASVTVPVHVNSEAETNQPEVSTPTVDQNATVDPNSVVTNQDTLPKGTTYSWTTEPKTDKAGQPATGSLHVTYPDGSSEDVPVTVNVKSNKDQYQPEVSTPTVDQNATVDPNSVVTNQDTLPKGTTYSWTTEPKTDKAGQPATGSLHVTYPDGSSEDVPVTVNVKSNKDQYQPEVSTPTVDQNATVDPNSVVTNQDTLPKGTTYSWTTEPKTDKAGQPATGSLHVTYPDGSSEDVPVTVNVKSNKDQYTLKPGTPVKVNDPAKLTDDEKGQVSAGIKKANPDAPIKSITVNDDGSADVTFNDDSKTTVSANVTKKTDADKYQLTQGTPVKVNDPAKLTDDEKGQVSAGIKKANPDAPIKSITVNDDGSADVTFNDDSKTTVSANVTKKTDADKYQLTQGTPVKVNDPAKLTDDEKGQVSAGIKKANPDAPIKSITVNDDGSADVTFNDDSKTTVSANVTKKTDADKYQLTQGTPVKVNDPAKLTDDEKGQVSAGIKKANPDAPIKSITVNDDGSADVTFNDDSKTTVSANVTKKTDADKYQLTQGTPVKVNDPAKLTDDEKGQVSAGIKKANPDAPIKSITVNDDGSADVTFNDDSKTTVSANVTKKTDADKYQLTQGTPVKVNDPAKLTDDEKGQVSAGIKKANPDAPIKSITVNDDGSADVTFNDDSKTTVSANVTKKTDADKYQLTQGTPVKVNDPAKLTDDEKGQVSAGIKKANPDAPIKSITVNDDGSADVTFNDDSKTTVSANVTKKTDADKYQLTQGTPVKVNDPAKLTDDEKGQVSAGIKKANPDAPIKSITVNDDGSADVTFNDDSKTTVSANVTKKTDADKYQLTQGTPVKVNDPAKLTDDEKGQVSAGIKKANPDAPIKSITVNDDGSADVTFNDDSKTTVSANVTKKTDADKYQLTQGTPVKVNDPAKLTDDEKGQVSAGIKKANPDAPIKSITVNDDGSADVTFNDDSKTTVSANVTKKTDADKYQLTQGTPVKVNDPAKLTDDEKGQVSAGIKKANPDAPIKSITVNDDGSADVTFNDDSKTTVSANVTKKTDADKYQLTQGTPVKVNDPAKLTDDEKGQVSAGIKKANPDAPIKSITVNDDGSADVTFNDDSKTTVSANVTKKTDADKYQLTQGTPVKVNDPAKLTDDEKGQVSAGIKKANPDAPIKSITVNDDGSADVTFNDDSKTTVSANVTKKTDADKYQLTQGTPVKVNDPAKLTDDEKGQVSAGIKKANPDAPIKSITVNDDGSADVTFNDDSKTTVSANVTKKTDADKYQLTQGTPVKVNDPAKLTDDEKGQVSAGIKKANPDAPIKSITVNDDGSADVTFNDDSKTTVSANVTKKTDADKYQLTQGTPVKVNDPAKLTDDEKGQVSAGIKKANPDAPIKSITVNDDGSADVTFNDDSKTTVSANVTKKTDADKYQLTQGTPVKVNDPAKLTDDEKGQVSAGIKKANPDAPIKSITVNDDGSADVTFNDDSKTTVSANVTKKTDADKYQLTQGTPVKVNDPAKLTDDEKGQVSAGIKKANPDAPIKSITVNDDGSADVTFNDDSKTTVSANVTKKTDADKYQLTQGTPVKVNDPAKLTDDEKGQVSAGIKKANPDAPIKSITVNDDGSADVTFNDDSKTTVSANVTKKTDADKYQLTQGTPVKVNDPAKLTDDEKGQVSAGIKKANPDAPIKSITVNDDGSADVTFNDDSKTTVSANVTKKTDADKYQLTQGTPVKVNDPAKLTDDEKGQVSAGIKKANPDAPIKSITVNDDGSADVTFNDDSKTTVSANVTKKTDADKYQLTQGTPVKVNDPAKLTDDEKGQVSAGIKKANPDAPIKSITVNDDGSADVTFNDDSKTTVSANVTKKTDAPTPTEKTVNVVFKGVDKKYDGKPAEVTVTITDQDGKDVDVTLEAGKDYTITKQSAAKARMLLATAKPLADAPTEVGTYHVALTEAGKRKLRDAGYTTVNETPADFTISPADTPTPTPDTKTDDEKYDPIIPGDKVKVDDPTKLTNKEKDEVVKTVEDANKDDNGNSTLPDGTKITVGDNGDVTVTYPDGSEDTIPGDKVVEGKTDADKTDVTVPGTKVEVGDPTKLTDSEKGQVEEAIKDANPKLPDGTKITVADDGTATITYPDGSVDQISAADLITKPTAAGQAGKGTGTTTTNGQGAPAGQGKADQAKTLPQTGNEQGSLLAASGLSMLLFGLLGLLGLGSKRKKED